MSDIDIQTVVRHIIDSTTLADPGDIAAKVCESLPDAQLREVLTVALRAYVRDQLAQHRWRTAVAASVPTLEAPVGSLSSNPTARSERVTAIRDAAPAWLRARVCAAGEWLLLGDCTPIHLAALDRDLHRQASRLECKREKYRHLLELCEQYAVSHVSDLPVEVLASVDMTAVAS